MAELSQVTRQRLVDAMMEIVSHNIGPDFDFVLVVRQGSQSPYVLTDVEPEQACSMLLEALHHPDQPAAA